MASVATVESSEVEAKDASAWRESPKILMLTWVFALVSVLGLIGETLQHYLAFNGELESRPGFIWGPFSPIYGCAGFLLTVLALRFDEEEQQTGKKHSALSIFLIAALVGGSLEYLCSWAMETFWGVVAWSYLNVPGNIDGRTDIFHMAVWGALGLGWVRLCYPLVKKAFSKINTSALAYRVITWALFVFLICDAFMTIAVMLRADARTNGVEATTAFERVIDEAYPTEMLQDRFENMGGLGMPD